MRNNNSCVNNLNHSCKNTLGNYFRINNVSYIRWDLQVQNVLCICNTPTYDFVFSDVPSRLKFLYNS